MTNQNPTGFNWDALPGSGSSAAEVESGTYLGIIDSMTAESTQKEFIRRSDGFKRPEGSRYYKFQIRLADDPGTPTAWQGLTLQQVFFVGMDHLDENGETKASDPEAKLPDTWLHKGNWDVKKFNLLIAATEIEVGRGSGGGLHPDDICPLVQGAKVWIRWERTPGRDGYFNHYIKQSWAFNEAPEGVGPQSEAGGRLVTTTTATGGAKRTRSKALKASLRNCEECSEQVDVATYAQHLREHEGVVAG